MAWYYKLLIITLIVFVFLAPNFIGLGFLSAVVVFILFLTKVPIKMYLRNLKPIIAIIILTALLNIFYVKDGSVLFSFWIFTVTSEGVFKAVFMATRIVLMILISSVLTYTTTPTELTDAIESLLSPLKIIKFPVHEIALVMSIALRFIPILMNEADRIIMAQKARGADFETGGLIKRAKAIVPILIPLFVSAVRRADELADAMECRCYHGGEGRTRLNVMKWHASDVLYMLVGVALCVGLALLNQIQLGYVMN